MSTLWKDQHTQAKQYTHRLTITKYVCMFWDLI